jgi:hypothetical protein
MLKIDVEPCRIETDGDGGKQKTLRRFTRLGGNCKNYEKRQKKEKKREKKKKKEKKI